MELNTFIVNRYKVMLVDCENELIDILKNVFTNSFEFIICPNTEEAINYLNLYNNDIALVLSKHNPPQTDGIEVLKKAKECFPNTIRILYSENMDASIVIDSINICEVYRYIIKPIDYSDLIRSIIAALSNRKFILRGQNLVKNLKDLLFSTVAAICEALEFKDSYTIGHSRRVTLYSLMLGKNLGLSSIELQKLHLAGLLHDIGKIAIPEHILNKPGKLTEEEFNLIKQHPGRGADIIRNLKQLGEVINWVESHHERFDGRGYPYNIQGDNIPFGAAILAVADTYDAMTSDRAYRKGLPHPVAIEEITKCTGSQFNPDMAKSFLGIEKNIEQIMLDKDNISKYSIQNLLQDSELLMEKICATRI